MKIFKYFFLVFTIGTLYASSPPLHKNQILYLTGTGQYKKAIAYYQKITKESKISDFETLQQMALILLENGAKSKNAEEERLAIFGSGLAASSKSLQILAKGLVSKEMASQLTALHFISMLQDNEADSLLIQAMNSDFLETRIEAAFQLAVKKNPCALGQIQSLMQKLPSVFKPFFPQFFALIGTSDSIRILKHFLSDPNPNVRVQTILSIAQNGRDDLLPFLRNKIQHSSTAEMEATAFSLAFLKDSFSIETLKKTFFLPIRLN